MQNIAFLSVGILGVLYIWTDSYLFNEQGKPTRKVFKFRLDKTALALIGLSVFSAVLWIYYPGYVENFSVQLETGEVWSNTNLFPQTLYTIDLNPTDNVNAGVWFYKENNLIHGWNTLVKVFWTFTVFYIGLVKKVQDSG